MAYNILGIMQIAFDIAHEIPGVSVQTTETYDIQIAEQRFGKYTNDQLKAHLLRGQIREDERSVEYGFATDHNNYRLEVIDKDNMFKVFITPEGEARSAKCIGYGDTERSALLSAMLFYYS
jgi:hypothetical protein